MVASRVAMSVTLMGMIMAEKKVAQRVPKTVAKKAGEKVVMKVV